MSEALVYRFMRSSNSIVLHVGGMREALIINLSVSSIPILISADIWFLTMYLNMFFIVTSMNMFMFVLFNRYRAFRRARDMRCMLYVICCMMYILG